MLSLFLSLIPFVFPANIQNNYSSAVLHQSIYKNIYQKRLQLIYTLPEEFRGLNTRHVYSPIGKHFTSYLLATKGNILQFTHSTLGKNLSHHIFHQLTTRENIL